MSPFYFAVAILAVGLAFPNFVRGENTPRVIEIQAKKFEFTPNEIHLKLGEPVVLRLKSLDRKHGFKVTELGVDAVIKPGAATDVALIPQKKGTFHFHCSVFCGSGHEGMTGVIIVD
ncbi:MAG: heme/copper-type cytochrome/quinol oxidase, subunit 2 [Bacteriovoracaceae bacterium]|nr:heme/copper-type cytochrome/quinol oxidase, subunit 2 [Bacteriovoracaceae bacterium]